MGTIRTIFEFTARGAEDTEFEVVGIKGRERLCRPYEFEITLTSSDPAVDEAAILGDRATLTLIHEWERQPYHGVLSQFEQLHMVSEDRILYKAVLVPKLWNLSLTHDNQVFLKQRIEDIIHTILQEGSLTEEDYELRLLGSYRTYEYVCQYNETHLDFLHQRLEREGIYYFFEQEDEIEKVVFTDDVSVHQPIRDDSYVRYKPESSGEAAGDRNLTSFLCRTTPLPQKIVLKDYNYLRADLDNRVELEVSERGRGVRFIYGEYFDSPQNGGEELARLRAEEIRCNERVFHGEGREFTFRPGFSFNLLGHFRPQFNIQYMLTEVTHRGSMASSLQAVLGETLDNEGTEQGYTNTFTAIPLDIPYRPPLQTERARFHGTISARLIGTSDGKWADMDELGRYKVRLPFDMAGEGDTRVTHWVRYMQPYGGADMGMNFPMPKDAEVLLAFVDGDPDRPVIQGTVSNSQNPSLISSGNQNISGLRTISGTGMAMHDEEGHEHVVMTTGKDAKSYMKLGEGSWGRCEFSSDYTHQGTTFGGAVTSDITNILLAGYEQSISAGPMFPVIVGAIVKGLQSALYNYFFTPMKKARVDPEEAKKAKEEAEKKKKDKKALCDGGEKADGTTVAYGDSAKGKRDAARDTHEATPYPSSEETAFDGTTVQSDLKTASMSLASLKSIGEARGREKVDPTGYDTKSEVYSALRTDTDFTDTVDAATWDGIAKDAQGNFRNGMEELAAWFHKVVDHFKKTQEYEDAQQAYETARYEKEAAIAAYAAAEKAHDDATHWTNNIGLPIAMSLMPLANTLLDYILKKTLLKWVGDKCKSRIKTKMTKDDDVKEEYQKLSDFTDNLKDIAITIATDKISSTVKVNQWYKKSKKHNILMSTSDGSISAFASKGFNFNTPATTEIESAEKIAMTVGTDGSYIRIQPDKQYIHLKKGSYVCHKPTMWHMRQHDAHMILETDDAGAASRAYLQSKGILISTKAEDKPHAKLKLTDPGEYKILLSAQDKQKKDDDGGYILLSKTDGLAQMTAGTTAEVSCGDGCMTINTAKAVFQFGKNIVKINKSGITIEGKKITLKGKVTIDGDLTANGTVLSAKK